MKLPLYPQCHPLENCFFNAWCKHYKTFYVSITKSNACGDCFYSTSYPFPYVLSTRSVLVHVDNNYIISVVQPVPVLTRSYQNQNDCGKLLNFSKRTYFI